MEEILKDWGDHFQTPEKICEYMGSFLPENAGLILEPTPGKGKLVKVLERYGKVITPDDFYTMEKSRFDWIVMNPPFTPMKEGYNILYKCMGMTDNIIALMPYLLFASMLPTHPAYPRFLKNESSFSINVPP